MNSLENQTSDSIEKILQIDGLARHEASTLVEAI